MGQQNLLRSRVCQEHNENQIVLVCFSKNCNLNRLLCSSCIKNHAPHAGEFLDQQKLGERIMKIQRDCKQLMGTLTSFFDELQINFKKLLQATTDNYDIQIEKVCRMDDNELNLFLNQINLYNENQGLISKAIQDQCQIFREKLHKCVREFRLHLNDLELKGINNRFAEDLYKYGYRYFKENEFQNAIIHLDQALNFNSNHLQSLILKGDCLIKIGQYNESIQSYDKALQISPNNIQILSRQDEALIMQKQYADALVNHNLALTNDNQNKTILASTGACLECQNIKAATLDIGVLDQTEQFFKQSILIQPNKQWDKNLLDEFQEKKQPNE